jgi:hypothetical protein
MKRDDDNDDEGGEEEPAKPMLAAEVVSEFQRKADRKAEISVDVGPTVDRSVQFRRGLCSTTR